MGHDHAHGHAHANHDSSSAFRLGTALNLAFVIVEVVAGLWAGSMALLADAGHNAGDVIGLLLAWGAASLAARPATGKHTYGLQRATLLAALANGGLLVFATGAVAWEAVRRLVAPEPVASGAMIIVALVGVGINVVAASLFWRNRKDDLNVRVAFVHLASDAGLSAGVVVVGLLIRATGWGWLDPVAGLLLSGTILFGTWSTLRESVDLLLDAVPDGIDPEKVRAYLSGLPGVSAIHDVHIWALGSQQTALTAHLVVAPDSANPPDVDAVAEALHVQFGIGHSTLQLEQGTAHGGCANGHP